MYWLQGQKACGSVSIMVIYSALFCVFFNTSLWELQGCSVDSLVQLLAKINLWYIANMNIYQCFQRKIPQKQCMFLFKTQRPEDAVWRTEEDRVDQQNTLLQSLFQPWWQSSPRFPGKWVTSAQTVIFTKPWKSHLCAQTRWSAIWKDLSI